MNVENQANLKLMCSILYCKQILKVHYLLNDTKHFIHFTLLSLISLTHILPPLSLSYIHNDPYSAGILTLLAFQRLPNSIVNGGFRKNCASNPKLSMGAILFLRHLIFWILCPLLYLSRLVFQCNLGRGSKIDFHGGGVSMCTDPVSPTNLIYRM